MATVYDDHMIKHLYIFYWQRMTFTMIVYYMKSIYTADATFIMMLMFRLIIVQVLGKSHKCSLSILKMISLLDINSNYTQSLNISTQYDNFKEPVSLQFNQFISRK